MREHRGDIVSEYPGGRTMNRLLLLAIILLIIAGMLLLWLSNRRIEQLLERSGRAAITLLVEGQNDIETLKAPKSLASLASPGLRCR